MKWDKLFLFVAVTCFGLQILGALVSIIFSMPAQVVFGGELLTPEDASPILVAQEFLSKGTALAPPLVLSVIYGLFLLLSSRKGITGIIGTIFLILIGILFTIATQGEYANPDRFPTMPAFIFLTMLVINNIFTIGISIIGATKLVSQGIQHKRNKQVHL